jgi:hypothetical protein
MKTRDSGGDICIRHLQLRATIAAWKHQFPILSEVSTNVVLFQTEKVLQLLSSVVITDKRQCLVLFFCCGRTEFMESVAQMSLREQSKDN